jgi:uncharacterized coiled-coil DUF342 family protein
MSEDIDLEALEAELWQLRSKEYDTSALRRELELAQAGVQENADIAEAYRKDRDTADAKVQELLARVKKLEKDYSDATAARVKAIQERDYLTRKLEAIEQAEYMHSTYGFEVTTNLPERGKRRGWRLTQ